MPVRFSPLLWFTVIDKSTVKKIRLRTAQGDNKIFREVNALSRLSHRYIVRYYTTWLEESEPTSSNVSSDSGDDGSEGSSDHTAGISMNKTPDFDDDPTSFDINELVLHEDTQTSSFPSIHFTSGDVADDSSDEEESSKQLVEQMKNTRLGFVTPPSLVRRTLYIQMVKNPVLFCFEYCILQSCRSTLNGKL